jgi:hypothetical protein
VRLTGLERRKKETVRCDRFPAVGFSPFLSFAPIAQARNKFSEDGPMSPAPKQKGSDGAFLFWPYFATEYGNRPPQSPIRGQNLEHLKYVISIPFAYHQGSAPFYLYQ